MRHHNDLLQALTVLKEVGCVGIKISFEDEGAQLSEMMTMRYLTSACGLSMSVKIGGCEAKRDLIDCRHLLVEKVVAPMIESGFAVKKFAAACTAVDIACPKGINVETIGAFRNLEDIATKFDLIDFVVVGRVDFTGSMGKDRSFVETDDMLDMTRTIFSKARSFGKQCFMGGAISAASSSFLITLHNEGLLDKFETRYAIFDANVVNDEEKITRALYLANQFELMWLQHVAHGYSLSYQKDQKRIEMIRQRLEANPLNH